MSLGKRLRMLREERQLTQKYVANQIGIGYNALSYYELDKREPDIETIRNLSVFYDVSIDFLLEKTDDRKNNIIEIPNELKELGVEYLAPVKEAKKYDITPDELQAMIEAIKKIKKDI